MIGAEPVAHYGLGVLTILILLRVVYQLASLTIRVAGYTLVVAAAAGIIEPSLIDPLLAMLPGTTDLGYSVTHAVKTSDGGRVVGVEIWWEYVEAWQSFGYHTVLGFLGVLTVYKVMEMWYPGAFVAGFLWLWGVVELDRYLLEQVLEWSPWMQIYPEVVYAGAVGFGLGVVFAVTLLEPQIQRTDNRSTAVTRRN